MINVYDLTEFAPAFFKIADKSGNLTPFKFNRAQQHVHERLEKQLIELGYVRANVLKGRQQGISTYISGRYFHKTLTIQGMQAFILTHMGDATRSLFAMTKRYNNNLPAGLAPKPDKDNENQLLFNKLNSGYRVGTAGSKEIGRSMTNQLLHLSEYAFYDNHIEIKRGIEQTVADIKGTEKIKESTANGINNAFYIDWQNAKEGESDYINIFVPWYWQDEYARDALGFVLNDEERDWMQLYGDDGLTVRHLAWRRMKLKDFDGDYEQKCKGFKQEYPFTDEEAFLNSITDTFITVEPVQRARKAQVESDSALIIGVDPARSGTDKSAIIRRRGRLAYKIEKYQGLDTMQLVGKLKTILDAERPYKMCIDCIGIGAGVVDRLHEMGYQCVEGVNVARSANNPDRFLNLRAELWHEMREWFLQDMPVQIPDDPELQKELCGLGYDHNSSGRLVIESKKDAKKRGMKSPDCFVAGTMIDTPSGKKPIELLSTGDYVNTPYGKAKIIKIWETVTEEITTLTLSNGKKIHSKPMHKVFTWDNGWVKIMDLTKDNVIETNSWINKIRWKFLNLLCTKVSSLEFKHQVDIIRQTSTLSRKDFYIDIYGKNILVKYQKDFTSIIKMVTGKIINWKIWNAFAVKNTCANICYSLCHIQNIDKEHWKGKKRPLLQRWAGINQMMERPSILLLQKKDGQKLLSMKKNVLNVKKHLNQSSRVVSVSNIAQESAGRQEFTRNKKLLKRFASSVIKNLWPINTEMLSVVVKNVQTENVLPTKVYNLTLDVDNVYYANGLLVANCADALMITFAYGQHGGTSSFQPNFMSERSAGMLI